MLKGRGVFSNDTPDESTAENMVLYRILQKSMILITKLLISFEVSTFCIPFDEF